MLAMYISVSHTNVETVYESEHFTDMTKDNYKVNILFFEIFWKSSSRPAGHTHLSAERLHKYPDSAPRKETKMGRKSCPTVLLFSMECALLCVIRTPVDPLSPGCLSRNLQSAKMVQSTLLIQNLQTEPPSSRSVQAGFVSKFLINIT